MRAKEYRTIIRTIVKSALNKKAPGFNKKACNELADLVAANVYARMYGANVDGVDSPLWRDSGEFNEPNVDAIKLLEEGLI